MKKIDKLIQKYANTKVILPPENDVELPDFKMPKAPVIVDPTEEEMLRWDRLIKEENLLQDLEKTKETSEFEEDKIAPEMGTIPAIPKKKVKASELLARCNLYYKLATK